MADTTTGTANENPSQDVTITGRLGSDPIRRETKTGIPVGNLVVAVYDRESGSTAWHRVLLWRDNADFAARELHIGDWVEVSGRLSTRLYFDRNGDGHPITEIVAFENGLRAIRENEKSSPHGASGFELS